MRDRRKELLSRLQKFSFVPGDLPDTEKMTDEDLENFVKICESMAKAGRRAKEE